MQIKIARFARSGSISGAWIVPLCGLYVTVAMPVAADHVIAACASLRVLARPRVFSFFVFKSFLLFFFSYGYDLLAVKGHSTYLRNADARSATSLEA